MTRAQITESVYGFAFSDQYDVQDTTSIPLVTIDSRSEPRGELPPALRNMDQSVASVDRLVSPLFDPIQKQISAFEKLKRNWDSYGADPIKKEAIQAALKLLSCLPVELVAEIGENMVPTAAVPVPDGGVQLEWVLANIEVEVEFEAGGSISCLLVWRKGLDPRFEEIAELTNESVVALLSKLFRVR